ncbi:uncharacterized protein PpBr36_11088 [Pyricularia pennisetigena]|uniref:uncharacterized protein n=1 Tax=Pyricularia pennisetigena TaxID=1578925 RepID=UPI00114DBEA8|nr:uncharacterized protein PpBr36_11088 [Pyricularia pennisetigena]TLS20599.1 hypothetical protein PpBr36_11088 [Pyricularia pennisetigena]
MSHPGSGLEMYERKLYMHEACFSKLNEKDKKMLTTYAVVNNEGLRDGHARYARTESSVELYIMCIFLFHFCAMCHKCGDIHTTACHNVEIECLETILIGLKHPHRNSDMYAKWTVLCDEVREDILSRVDPTVT